MTEVEKDKSSQGVSKIDKILERFKEANVSLDKITKGCAHFTVLIQITLYAT